MGDEVRRTQGGNNNGYCHDDPSTWFDWSQLETHADVHRFISLLAARRVLRDIEHEHRQISLNQLIANATKAWHGVKLGEPDWGKDSHSVMFTADLQTERMQICLILNAHWDPLTFELPSVASRWRRWIDTALPSPQDIVEWQTATEVPGSVYHAGARSVVMLYVVAP